MSRSVLRAATIVVCCGLLSFLLLRVQGAVEERTLALEKRKIQLDQLSDAVARGAEQAAVLDRKLDELEHLRTRTPGPSVTAPENKLNPPMPENTPSALMKDQDPSSGPKANDTTKPHAAIPGSTGRIRHFISVPERGILRPACSKAKRFIITVDAKATMIDTTLTRLNATLHVSVTDLAGDLASRELHFGAPRTEPVRNNRTRLRFEEVLGEEGAWLDDLDPAKQVPRVLDLKCIQRNGALECSLDWVEQCGGGKYDKMVVPIAWEER